jgi:hypothetical protein
MITKVTIPLQSDVKHTNVVATTYDLLLVHYTICHFDWVPIRREAVKPRLRPPSSAEEALLLRRGYTKMWLTIMEGRAARTTTLSETRHPKILTRCLPLTVIKAHKKSENRLEREPI